MERSALVYVGLTVICGILGLYVDNREYVPRAVEGGRRYGGGPCTRTRARNRIALWAVYCLMAGVSACRIAVGNDYWVYRENFNLIAQNRHVSSELGFNYIVKWLQTLFGYDAYLPVFAFFSLVTVFFFVKALEDQGSYFAFSLYLLMTGGYYFNSLNSVRYYLALAIALYAMKYVLRGEYGKFLLWILAGAMFHKSILLVFPVYLAARFLAAAPLKKWHYGVGLFFLGTLMFGQEVYRDIIFYFYPYYRDSHFDNGQISYANILKCICPGAVPGVWQAGTQGGSDEQVLLFSECVWPGGILLRILCAGGVPGGILSHRIPGAAPSQNHRADGTRVAAQILPGGGGSGFWGVFCAAARGYVCHGREAAALPQLDF